MRTPSTKRQLTTGRKAGGVGVRGPEGAYDSLFEHSLDCVKLVAADGRLLRINRCGCDSLEICDPSEAVGQNYFEFWSGTDAANALAAAREATEAGSGRFTGTYSSPSGRITHWDEMITAIRDPDAADAGYLIISRDVTEVTRRLSQQHALAELGSAALGEESFDDFLQALTDTVSRVLDCPMVKVLQFADDADVLQLKAGVGWNDGLVGKAMVGTERDSQAGYTLLVNDPVVVRDLETETRFSGPLLLRQHKVRSGMSVVIAGVGRRPYGVFGVHAPVLREFEDADRNFLQAVANIISARWRQECASRDHQALLQEMAHRVTNLLQVADSLFRQTFEFSTDIAAAKRTYSARLAAMGRSSAAITRGGLDTVSLAELAANALNPFGELIRVSGPDISIKGELAFDLGLIWHELATNSAKYGALKTLDGQVDLSWDVEGEGECRMLRLHWRDSSQPAAQSPDNGGGFGSKFMAQLVKVKHRGTIKVSQDTAYHCEIRLPIV
ncbi:sensor histidine kinase [Maricaulis sp. CAU 1757]